MNEDKLNESCRASRKKASLSALRKHDLPRQKKLRHFVACVSSLFFKLRFESATLSKKKLQFILTMKCIEKYRASLFLLITFTPSERNPVISLGLCSFVIRALKITLCSCNGNKNGRERKNLLLVDSPCNFLILSSSIPTDNVTIHTVLH